MKNKTRLHGSSAWAPISWTTQARPDFKFSDLNTGQNLKSITQLFIFIGHPVGLLIIVSVKFLAKV